MSQEEPRAESQNGAEDAEPVIFYDASPPPPLLGPLGALLALATFFYFFL